MALDKERFFATAHDVMIPEVDEVRDRIIQQTGTFTHQVDILRPPVDASKPRPVIVFAHGGGYVSGDQHGNRELLRWLVCALDLVVVSTNYPLAPVTKFPRPMFSVANAVRWTRANAEDLQIDPERVVLMGASAGGYYGGMVALTHDNPALAGAEPCCDVSAKPQWLVNLWGPTDFIARWFDNDGHPGAEYDLFGAGYAENPAVYHEASMLTYMRPDAPPALFVQGRNDPTVHRRQGELGHAAWQAAGCESELVMVDHIGHGHISREDECYAYQRVHDWLEQRL